MVMDTVHRFPMSFWSPFWTKAAGPGLAGLMMGIGYLDTKISGCPSLVWITMARRAWRAPFGIGSANLTHFLGGPGGSMAGPGLGGGCFSAAGEFFLV